ncbi:MAG: radical SAM protein [Candidatus Helarchaeota archaeon]
MRFTILDCYTDEPAGLGVPPYIGTYPRYIAGAIRLLKHKTFYLTIDDLRFYAFIKRERKLEEQELQSLIQSERRRIKTNIRIKNLSKNIYQIGKILKKTDILVIIAGIQTPGRYLAALPGTTKELALLLETLNFQGFTILTGPAAGLGSGLWGGKRARARERDQEKFDLIIENLEFKLPHLIENQFTTDVEEEGSYAKLEKLAIAGASIVKEHPDYPAFLIAEIETSRGCPRAQGCSFCTEPIKAATFDRRPISHILNEIEALSKGGIQNFRLGKQSCFYSYGSAETLEKLLRGARQYAKILHIDNVNPRAVTEDKTKVIVQYCTEGNVAAFGVESFDPKVIRANNLNIDPQKVLNAIQILNKYGRVRGFNGMPKFLPGINLLFGLDQETKATHEHNIHWLKRILEEKLLLRRINIREVIVFPGTPLAKVCGTKFLRKNRKWYWKWRQEIRQKIDELMLKRLLPIGTILRRVRTEIYDGKTTFGRQIGTYPLIVGIQQRLPLDRFFAAKVIGHMYRSVIAEPIEITAPNAL